MLPNFMYNYKGIRPTSRDGEEVIEYFKILLAQGYSKKALDEYTLTAKEAINILNLLEINTNSAFYEFYSRFRGVFPSNKEYSDDIYTLDEIFESYQQPFWGDQYPNIEKRYLQMSSIEGEYSYFYDKETDALYGVDWGEMDDFMNGNLKPLFTSFYDFLEWYYSEEDED